MAYPLTVGIRLSVVCGIDRAWRYEVKQPTWPHLLCSECHSVYGFLERRTICDCGGLLSVEHDLAGLQGARLRQNFAERWAFHRGPDASGVWRYRELVAPCSDPVTRPEGNTNLYALLALSDWSGCPGLILKHEGENPTGSFKDRGMTVGVSMAREVGATAVVCASTGNTSSSLASYSAFAGVPCVVLVPLGKVSAGKLAQTIAYGARVVQIEGDFDAALDLARSVCQDMGLYLLNSINPWRLEGQKTIIFELMQQLDWKPPDWIVVPGGNLGNTSAFGKALRELHTLGLIDRIPRLAVVQAEGANPFYQAYAGGFTRLRPVSAHTVATAINIGNPANYPRARQALIESGGVVTQVSDAEILEAKATIDRTGIGCEPASAATVAGVRRLVRSGVITPGSRVVGILTGHVLKDTDAIAAYQGERGWRPLVAAATAGAVRSALEGATA